MADLTAELHHSLQASRAGLLSRLEGLGEYDLRRPRTPTGTNLLGLVKHLTWVEAGYLGVSFDRAYPGWDAFTAAVEADPQADMWARADEPMADVVAGYRAVWAHADATIAAVAIDAEGRVPWWGVDAPPVTLQRVLIHLPETQRHAGQMDIVRELIDGKAGLRPGSSNLPDQDDAWWAGYRARLEQVAGTAEQ